MSFKKWFCHWIELFYKLMLSGVPKYKSEAQRENERNLRLRKKYSLKNKYRIEKQRTKKGKGINPWWADAFANGIGFLAATFIGVLLLPFLLFDFTIKQAKRKKGTKKSSTYAKKTNMCIEKSNNRVSDFQRNPCYDEKTTDKTNVEICSRKEAFTRFEHDNSNSDNSGISEAASDLSHQCDSKESRDFAKIEPAAELDEKIPKSIPRSKKDKYIRRRMIIAGSSYCDKETVSKLSIGDFLDAEREPENPYDKNAVKLLLDGEKVGYVPKNDTLAFVACFDIGCKIYAIVTDIIHDGKSTKYEFEAWIVNNSL